MVPTAPARPKRASASHRRTTRTTTRATTALTTAALATATVAALATTETATSSTGSDTTTGPTAGADLRPVGDDVLAGFVTVADPVGDAPRGVDIKRLSATNGRAAVTVSLDFRRVNQAAFGRIRAQVDVGTPLGEGYFLLLVRRTDGTWERHLKWAPMYGEYGDKDMPCARLRMTWDGNRLDVRLPRRCMTKPRDNRIRVSADTENKQVTGFDVVPDKTLFTPWVRRV